MSIIRFSDATGTEHEFSKGGDDGEVDSILVVYGLCSSTKTAVSPS